MAFTLRIRTTISPRRWQPWTAGIAVGYMNGRTRQQSTSLLPRRAQRSTPLSVSATAKLVRVVQCKNWYFFKIIWAHRSIFPIPSPYACRGRTVLRFPTNSYHLFTVELVLKQCFFALASEIEGLCHTDSPVHI